MSALQKHSNVLLIFAVRSFGALSAFLLNSAIALALDPRLAGIFFLGQTIILFLALAGRAGADNLLVKNFSISRSVSNESIALDTYSFALKRPGFILLSLSVILFISSDYLSSKAFSTPDLSLALKYLSPSILFTGLSLLNSQALLGLRLTNKSIIISNILLPLLASSAIFIAGIQSVNLAALTFTLSSLLTLLISTIFLPFNPLAAIKINCSSYWQQCFPFFWVSVSSQCILWAGQLISGIYADPEEIAQFTVALRLAMLVSFSLLVCNSIFSPLFAKAHHEQKHRRLKTLAQQSSALSIILSSPIIIGCLIFPKPLMNLFGESYSHGTTLLPILAAGQIVNVACGSVGQLLMMCGKETSFRNMTVIAGSFSILMSIILVPHIGILGAAISTSLSIIIQNIVAAFAVKRFFGFWISPRFRLKIY